MSYLLDTNVVSELRKGPRASPAVRQWLGSLAPGSIWLSVLAIAELRVGVERIRPRDPAQAAALERWLTRLSREHDDRILPVDRRVAERWARLEAERSGAVIDLLLVATALEHGLTLATRNTRHIAWTGVAHLNPFVRP